MKAKITLIALAIGAMGMAHAAVTAEEAARLGKDLTPWGAEKAGNKEGTIPPYTGGMPVDFMGPGWDSNKSLKAMPPNNRPRQFMPDPYKDEKPLYRITTSNLSQYADKLSEATKALFKNDPSFYMDVYPTHRVVNYPKYYIDSSLANATRCVLEADGETYHGCKGGMPFPIPKNGNELMLNLQWGGYYGPGQDGDLAGVYVDRNGNNVMTADTMTYYQFPFQDPRYSLADFENPEKSYANLVYRLTVVRLGPPRIAGEAQVLLFTADKRNAMSWTYQPGNRRVRTTPNVEYDFPLASAGGAGFYDEAWLFQGKRDKYDWKMLGKKEMIMPYNNYRYHWGDKDEVLQSGHVNPKYMRWELHRAWVVEGTRKPGARHAFAKRRIHFDEDSPASGMTDNFDDNGKIMRGNFNSVTWIPDYQQNAVGQFFNCDVVSGALSMSIHGGYGVGPGMFFRNPVTGLGGITPDGKMLPDSEFTPEALPRRSAR